MLVFAQWNKRDGYGYVFTFKFECVYIHIWWTCRNCHTLYHLNVRTVQKTGIWCMRTALIYFTKHISQNSKAWWCIISLPTNISWIRQCYLHTLWIIFCHTSLLCLVNRSPHRPCHIQGLHRPPFLTSQRRSPKSPQNRPPSPLWPCCVSFRQPLTGRLLPCGSPSLWPVCSPPPWGNSSRAGASLFLQQDSPLRCCTRLWIWSTNTEALRTMSTVTTLMASTAPSPTGTEMTDCCRPCLKW